MILYSTDSTFDVDVSGVLPVLVVFFGEWCGPCRVLAPIIDEIEKDLSDKLTVVKVDIDKCLNIPTRFNVKGIPTCILLKNKKEVARTVGGVKDNLMKLLNKEL